MELLGVEFVEGEAAASQHAIDHDAEDAGAAGGRLRDERRVGAAVGDDEAHVAAVDDAHAGQATKEVGHADWAAAVDIGFREELARRSGGATSFEVGESPFWSAGAIPFLDMQLGEFLWCGGETHVEGEKLLATVGERAIVAPIAAPSDDDGVGEAHGDREARTAGAVGHGRSRRVARGTNACPVDGESRGAVPHEDLDSA